MKKLTLITEFGPSYFACIQKQERETVPEKFQSLVTAELLDTENQLTQFLNKPKLVRSHKMNEKDSIGWQWYREMSDKYTVLNYFKEKQRCRTFKL